MLSLFVLSLGLAMDAVAVSLVRGATGKQSWSRAIEIGAVFGAAQAIMPLIGWSLGTVFSDTMAAAGHWIAFVLLSFLGAKMLVEAAQNGEEEALAPPRSHYAGLMVAALATSIDAAAAGVTLPLLKQPIAAACFVIGSVTAVLSFASYWFGTRVSPKSGKVAEIIGGLALIGLGAKFLIEHFMS